MKTPKDDILLIISTSIVLISIFAFGAFLARAYYNDEITKKPVIKSVYYYPAKSGGVSVGSGLSTPDMVGR